MTRFLPIAALCLAFPAAAQWRTAALTDGEYVAVSPPAREFASGIMGVIRVRCTWLPSITFTGPMPPIDPGWDSEETAFGLKFPVDVIIDGNPDTWHNAYLIDGPGETQVLRLDRMYIAMLRGATESVQITLPLRGLYGARWEWPMAGAANAIEVLCLEYPAAAQWQSVTTDTNGEPFLAAVSPPAHEPASGIMGVIRIPCTWPPSITFTEPMPPIVTGLNSEETAFGLKFPVVVSIDGNPDTWHSIYLTEGPDGETRLDLHRFFIATLRGATKSVQITLPLRGRYGAVWDGRWEWPMAGADAALAAACE